MVSAINSQMSSLLLGWYDDHARSLPWRTSPDDRKHGVIPDPYHIWLSEIMLQQTTVPHAAPYFLKFLKLWPRVEELASATIEDVTREWAGLGYYARARNLYKCARQVTERGGFPETLTGLQELAGVGPYTAAAIGAIAFDLPIAPVDGNIERVISRLYCISDDGTPAGWARDKKLITNTVQTLVPPDRPGDFAQAMMDLGATICTPKNPSCLICPVKSICKAKQEDNPESYPAKPKRKPQSIRYGYAYIVQTGSNILLQRRPDTGLLGGMLMPISSEWKATLEGEAHDYAPIKADWTSCGVVRHVFTHFALEWHVYLAKSVAAIKDTVPVASSDVLEAGLPTVGRKAVKLALDYLG